MLHNLAQQRERARGHWSSTVWATVWLGLLLALASAASVASLQGLANVKLVVRVLVGVEV